MYFQQPPSKDMVYPCIVYNQQDENVVHATNRPYRRVKKYQVTVIDRNPDSAIPDRIGALPLCVFNRFFTTDGLNHYVYDLYF